MAWYYRDGDQEVGPVGKEELQDLINAKRIGRQTLVRSKSMNEWKPLADVVRGKKQAKSDPPAATEAVSRTESTDKPQETESAAKPPETKPDTPSEAVICSQCGGSFPKNQVVTFDDQAVCAACKPAFVQKIKEGATLGREFRYAGFWIRVGAKIIDSLIVGGVNFIIGMILGTIFGTSAMFMDPENGTLSAGYWLFLATQQLIGITIPACYNTYLVGRFGATVGKMACGLKVVTPSGGRVSYPRALGRNFAEWISNIILGIGYIMVAFDSEKRSLHDRICSTRVIHKQ
jgi:uncharacterized RDD family membrane protein YckC